MVWRYAEWRNGNDVPKLLVIADWYRGLRVAAPVLRSGLRGALVLEEVGQE